MADLSKETPPQEASFPAAYDEKQKTTGHAGLLRLVGPHLWAPTKSS